MNIFKRASKEKLDSKLPVYVPIDQKQLFMDTYEFGQKIGRGTFATVYQVTRKSDSKVFACKELDFIKNIDALRNEILILSTLRHESICGMIEFFLIEEVDRTTKSYKIYLILDYCSGGELFDRIVQVSGDLDF
jgi:calcium-dependent protein kinase